MWSALSLTNFNCSQFSTLPQKKSQQDYEAAIADFNKAIEILPRSAEAYIHRWFARLMNNDKAGGCADFSKAVELGENYAIELIKEHCE